MNENIEILTNELSIVKSQLSSKCQAICILKKELEEARKEAKQFKNISEQLQELYKELRDTLDTGFHGHFTNGLEEKTCVDLKVKLNELEMQNRILEVEIKHLRKRNSELAEDCSLKSCEEFSAKHECGGHRGSVENNDRESLISQLELKIIECERLKRELELCKDEKEELIIGKAIISDTECRSTKCKNLYIENQRLMRQVNRLEADKKLLNQSLAKYLETVLPLDTKLKPEKSATDEAV